MMKKLMGAAFGLGLIVSSALGASSASADEFNVDVTAVNVQSNGLTAYITGSCPNHKDSSGPTKVTVGDITHTLAEDAPGTFALFDFDPSGAIKETVTCLYYNGDSDTASYTATAADKKGAQIKVSSALGEYQATVGQEITITATGLTSDQAVTFHMHSEPTSLGTVNADANGVATLTVKVPAGKEVGDHWITASTGSKVEGVAHLVIQSEGAQPAPKAPAKGATNAKKPGAPRTGV